MPNANLCATCGRPVRHKLAKLFCSYECYWESMRSGRGCRPSDAHLIEMIGNRVSPEPMSGCWLWTGQQTTGGYGLLSFRGWRMKAHRASWEAHTSRCIPEGMFICHSCDNPSCVNPSHLFVGTRKDNIRDMVRKRRGFRQNATHCIHGHAFTPENTKHYRGKKICRTCRASILRVYAAKKRARDMNASYRSIA